MCATVIHNTTPVQLQLGPDWTDPHGTIDDLRTQLARVCDEAWFVLSGGDDPHDRCTECGTAGYGMLRDALKDAEALLPPDYKEHSRWRKQTGVKR